MKFSILIANYNNGRFFKTCYDSIVKQTYNNWEAIILDDKSTDNSLEIIKDLIKNDNRFKLYEQPKNEGVGVVKSKLIELATGDICGFVDPDDAIKKTALASAINEFQKNSGTVLTYSRFIKCDEFLNEVEVSQSAKQVVNDDPFFFNCPIKINHFVCFRRDVYLRTEKMNSKLKISEDQDLYLKMYEKGNVKFIDEANYLYRAHAGGISQNENKKKSYEYWGEAIWLTMKRRGLKTINGNAIPETYHNSEEIFKLLSYQNSLPYRIKQKIRLFFQKIF